MAQSQQLTALGIDCGSHTFVATVAQSTAGGTPSYAIVRNSLSNSETPAIFACSSSRLMVGEAAVAERETGGNKYAAPTLGLALPPSSRLPVLASEFENAVLGSDGVPLLPYEDGASFSFQHMVGSLVMEVSAPVRCKADASSVAFYVTSPFADVQFARAMKDAAHITGCPIAGVFPASACLADLYHSRHADNAAADEESNVLIVDVGGRHTVAAVVAVTRDSWRVLHSSVARVGAWDVDAALARHFRAKFESEKRCINPRALPRLSGSCERLKKMLSTIDKAAVECEGLFGETDASLVMNRSEFDSIVQPLSLRVRDVVAAALAAAAAPAAGAVALTAVELLGGGARVAPFKQAVEAAIANPDLKLSRTLDDSSSLARGCAQLALKLAHGDASAAAAVISTDSAEHLLSATHLQAAKDLNDKIVAKEREFVLVEESRNAIEAYLVEMRLARDGAYKHLIDAAVLNAKLDDTENWLYDDGDSASVEQLTARMSALQSSISATFPSFFEKQKADKEAKEAMLAAEAAAAAAEAALHSKDDHDNRAMKYDERMRLASKNKEEGNSLLKDGQFPSAAERYIKSLTHIQKMFDLNPEQTKASKELALSCHLNLAMCFMKLEAWTKVIDNCEKALLIDLSNAKALYRRASALYMKKEYKLALSDLRRTNQEDAAVQELAAKCNAGLKAEADKHKKMFGSIFQKKEESKDE